MRDLDIAYVKVVIGKDRATHRTDEDCLVLQTKILQSFSDQFVYQTMSAAGAVVGLPLSLGLAVVSVIKYGRFRVDDSVLLAVGLSIDVCCNFGYGRGILDSDAVLVCHRLALFELLRLLRRSSNRYAHAAQHLFLKFLDGGHIAPSPAVELHRNLVLQCQPHIFHHLSVA